MTAKSRIEDFGRLVGEWTTESTHPMVPGTIVHGSTSIEWLDGEKFLIVRSQMDHPQFPNAISILGDTTSDRADGGAEHPPADAPAKLTMQYFDSRGVFRAFDTEMDGTVWRYERIAPGFSQRFTGTLSDDGRTIVGESELRQDDVHWKSDLKTTYRRVVR